MYVRVWKKKGANYASLVKGTRVNNKVKQEIIIYFGVVSEEQIPYLKAAFSSKSSRLHFEGKVYEK